MPAVLKIDLFCRVLYLSSYTSPQWSSTLGFATIQYYCIFHFHLHITLCLHYFLPSSANSFVCPHFRSVLTRFCHHDTNLLMKTCPNWHPPLPCHFACISSPFCLPLFPSTSPTLLFMAFSLSDPYACCLPLLVHLVRLMLF